MVLRIVINKEGKKFLVKDTSQDLHTQYGFLKKEDLKKKSGSKLVSNTGKEFSIFDARFIDLYRKIKRGAQIIPLKDIGLIISETGISKKSKVLDSGSGSGATTCFLANIVKEVISYEIREDFFKIVEKNIKNLGLKNVKLKHKDIYLGISEKNLDLIVLDLPEPWKVIEHAAISLKPGAFLVSYSPTIPQVMDFVDAIRKNEKFSYLKTSEIIEREWEVESRKVRPRSQAIGHSGFLSFVRKI
ncbi:tRNA (adenine-N1)-methyltransferase [Candidatus Woesearchaeota archaeon]|nr:tRNA (adenine-N1)-methyltransferase [Candidatus Woesearchaeota archaeon]